MARKVIFDSDMAYLNDDAIAMFMLAQADTLGKLELLGVTIVGGNVFVPEGTTSALRQLELIGRPDIKVYMGSDEPTDGFRDMREEEKEFGTPYYCGAYWDFETNDYFDLSKRSKDYLHLTKEPLYGYPQTRAQEQTAWDFMIEQVHKYPGEVTIMAVGAAINVYKALEKDPTIVDDAAGIIYMGGDIDIPGNATPAAEINWFYDTIAIKKCLAANWKSQIVVPDDLAHKIILTQKIYDRLAEKRGNKVSEFMLTAERTFNDEGANYVWDVVVPAIFMKPELATRVETRYITVDDRKGLNSGRVVSWGQHQHNDMETGKGMPVGLKKAQIVLDIDADAFWDFYVDILTK